MKLNKKIVSALLIGCMAAIPLTACSNNNTAQEEKPATEAVETTAYTFTDAMGQEITVENPQRVVSLMGSFTEVWLLAGGYDSLVGITDDTYDDRNLELPEDVQIVGNYREPNVEAILALNPDLVLLSAETTSTDTHVALKDALANAGITAAYFSVTHFEDYLAMLETCTKITGDTEAYQTNGLDVQQQIADVIAENKVDTNPDVLLMITFSGGIRPQTSSSMTGKMLADLGCHNIIDDNPSQLKDYSVENVIEADPDYIFVIPMGNDDASAEKALKDTVESNPAWSSLTAVQNGNYILLPKDKFLYKPNVRWADSYSYLADLIHE